MLEHERTYDGLDRERQGTSATHLRQPPMTPLRDELECPGDPYVFVIGNNEQAEAAGRKAACTSVAAASPMPE